MVAVAVVFALARVISVGGPVALAVAVSVTGGVVVGVDVDVGDVCVDVDVYADAR